MIKVIVTKQTVSEGFYVMLEGHKPNPKFRGVVSYRIDSYKEAYWISRIVLLSLTEVGNKAECFNDVWSEKDAKAFCDEMALECFETIKE